jgi:hypothetical protein
MLGEKLGEEHGRVTSRRILPGDDYRYVKMEVSFESEATILGQTGMNMGTYVIFERVPGQMYAEGRGIFMTNDGQGAIWNGHGVARMTGEGMGTRFAGSVAFQAGEGALAHLNEVLVVFEHEAKDDGSAHSELWEWKA